MFHSSQRYTSKSNYDITEMRKVHALLIARGSEDDRFDHYDVIGEDGNNNVFHCRDKLCLLPLFMFCSYLEYKVIFKLLARTLQG